MKKILILLFLAATTVTIMAQNNIYDFTVTDNKGNEVQLSQYEGKVILIVNTATACGFTPQYSELEALYEAYAERDWRFSTSLAISLALRLLAQTRRYSHSAPSTSALSSHASRRLR